MYRFVLLALVSTLSVGAFQEACSASADEWGSEPLGAPVEVSAPEPPPLRQKLTSRYRSFPVTGDPLVLFENGEARCALVLPDRPSDSEKQAAELLVSTFRKMTGVAMPIYREGKLQVRENDGGWSVTDEKGGTLPGVIWIGKTTQAARAEILAETLIPEGFRLQTAGSSLFIIGNDLSPRGTPVRGTFNGALALLERHFGVRWLWPGELGSVIATSKALFLPPLHEQDEPLLRQRIIRNSGRINSKEELGLKVLGLDSAPEEYLKRKQLDAVWMARQRTGSSKMLGYGHAFGDWYERFGTSHPEWFALQPDGTRVQLGSRPRLCKSNRELAHEAARQVLEKYQKSPNMDCVSVSPADGGSVDFFCMCVECRKLDPSNGEPVNLLFAKGEKRRERFRISYPSLSDRVTTFYNRIAEEVVRENPEAKIGAYAYSAYRNPPLQAKVHPAIIIGFVGFDYFNEAQREADLKRWDGWAASVQQLVLRPNLLSGGAGLPSVYVNRLGADLRHGYETGMIATDFDSFPGHWATQGLNYYVLAKLLWDPSLKVETVVDDYCKTGFGEAAPQVKQYFKELETLTTRLAAEASERSREELREEEQEATDPRAIRKGRFQTAACAVYTPETLQALRKLLGEALQADPDQTVQARIRFLLTGLDYADREMALYRATLANEDLRDCADELRFWHQQTFQDEPLAINPIARLYRQHTLFRGR